jgi:hypothetical protein
MAKLKYLVLGVFLQTFAIGRAQQTSWEFIHRTPNDDEESIALVEGSGGSIYFGGRTIALGLEYPYKSLVFKLDKYGNFIDSVLFNLPGKWTSLSQIIPKNNEEYVLLSTFHDLSPPFLNAGLLLHNMNSNLELFNQNVFCADTNYTSSGGYGYKISSGNLFVNFSVRFGGALYHSYLIETDSNFNVIKYRFLNDSPTTYSHLKTLDNGNYWGLNLILNKYEIFDYDFNKIQEQTVPELLRANFGVKWDSDSSFYLLGDKIVDNQHNLGFIRQYHYIDTTGYLYNSWGEADTLDFPAFTNGIDFHNKDSIFIGGTHNMPYALDPGQQPVPTWFVILQTDSLLNVRWERFYGGNANYLMTNLIATRDGGCLIAGTRYDYMNDPVPQTDIIVLKLNSEGLLVGNNEQPETRMHEAIVFPNPGTEALQVRLAVQHPTALLELFDTNGRLVFSQQLHQKENRIAVGHLPAGTYIYNLSADTGLRESGRWVKL